MGKHSLRQLIGKTHFNALNWFILVHFRLFLFSKRPSLFWKQSQTRDHCDRDFVDSLKSTNIAIHLEANIEHRINRYYYSKLRIFAQPKISAYGCCKNSHGCGDISLTLFSFVVCSVLAYLQERIRMSKSRANTNTSVIWPRKCKKMTSPPYLRKLTHNRTHPRSLKTDQFIMSDREWRRESLAQSRMIANYLASCEVIMSS